MFPEYFALIEAIVAAFLAVLLGYKYIQHRKYYHLAWMVFLVLWFAGELGFFLQFIYGSSPITEKILSLLHMPAMAVSGLGMLFLLQGFELLPKLTIRKPWPKYFLVYLLIIYGILVGTVLIAGVQHQTADLLSLVLLRTPGAFITISGSIASLFQGARRNILIAIGLFLGIAGERIGLILWHSSANWINTIGETLMGVGLLVAIQPPRKDDEK